MDIPNILKQRNNFVFSDLTLEHFNANTKANQKLIEASYDAGQHLYFICTEDMSAVKIGKAKDPLDRLASLQTSNHNKLKIYFVMSYGGGLMEKYIHAKFKAHHIRGEWFEFAQPIKDDIEILRQICRECGMVWDKRIGLPITIED